MIDSRRNRVQQLEHTVLELGTEIYKMRNEVSCIKEDNLTLTNTIKELRQILDEKGFVTEDEFENISLLDPSLENESYKQDDGIKEIEKIKKTSH